MTTFWFSSTSVELPVAVYESAPVEPGSCQLNLPAENRKAKSGSIPTH